MRRLCLSLFGVLLLLAFSLPLGATAQEATPAGGLADAELPQLDITMTADNYEGIPDQVEAGRYLVSLTLAEGAAEFGGGIAFVQPAGMTADEFLSQVMGPPDESGVGQVASTPIEGVEASPAGGTDDIGGIPDVLFEVTYAGGVYTFGNEATQVVLDLGPGEWVAWADDPAAPQQPVVFEVTGEMPAELAEPESAATITMGEYIIEVTEGELTSGPQVIRVDNIGAQPHFIAWFQGPEGMTGDQIQVVLDEEQEAMMTGTPPAWSGLNPDEDFLPITFTASQSTDTSIWIAVNLEPGTHGLACFFPDIGDGMPHAYHGMYVVVEVPE